MEERPVTGPVTSRLLRCDDVEGMRRFVSLTVHLVCGRGSSDVPSVLKRFFARFWSVSAEQDAARKALSYVADFLTCVEPALSGSIRGSALSIDKSICGLRSSETHPLNLSISISGGKETNRDSLSNGERSGKKPRSEISQLAIVTVGRIVVWRGGLSRSTACEPEVDLERHAREGESPVGHGNR